MNLTTTYLGMPLRSPLVPSASPLSQDLDNIKRMEDSGAGAVVLYSLFEEQIRADQAAVHYHMTYATNSFPEALTFFPEPAGGFPRGPEGYLDHIRRAKEVVDIPIIASLNGCSPGGWTEYAHEIEQAGADALELNIYYIPTSLNLTGAQVEQTYIDIVQDVKATVSIPVAVKLSPFFSSMAHMARRLDEVGADGLVLFNRFYQPDVDLEHLEVRPHLLLSTPQALRLPLTWIGLLHRRIRANLAGSGGVASGEDALKLLMVGADVTMCCAVLLRRGIAHLRTMEADLRAWMVVHEYESVRQLQGSLSQEGCPDPAAFERAQYIQALQSIHPAEPRPLAR
jgi:dihydroorotate dehydrogenase (fumarate)